MSFVQPGPRLTNTWRADRALRHLVERLCPEEVYAAIAPDLDDLGALAAGPLAELQAADRLREPVHTAWSPFGERIDHIELTPLWKEAARVAAERGMIGIPYEKAHGAASRVHQFALAYLFNPSTDSYTCPLAMTDGAAKTLLASGNAALIERALPRLTSRDPARAWTSGQWMTETPGGSDVGRTETRATREADGTWRLHGRKWFSSATTSDMAITLARPEGNGPGSRALALFYLETRDAEGRLRNIVVDRLKNKLGTRKLPTAELSLLGTPAILVGETTHGVRAITPMLNVTRTWNAVMAASGMARGITLARAYAHEREAFGAKLTDKPLHLDTLAEMQSEHEAALQLAFFAVRLLGREESGALDEDGAALLRLVTPIAKLVTGKQAVATASEVLECFGGAGYVEDTGLPQLLRDAQVLSIWEGTTNVLSLDVLKTALHGPGIEPIARAIDEALADSRDPSLQHAAHVARDAIRHAHEWLLRASESPAAAETSARRFATTLGRALSLALLIEQAEWELRTHETRYAAAAARRFAVRLPARLEVEGDERELRELALGSG